ncbi:MAG: hypothetical protein AAGI69_01340 [Cyanobacteria bacterium P01_H01_bin.21]
MRAALRVSITVSFAIAAVGILVWNLQPVDRLVIALALALLCVDQGRMALVDLNDIRRVTLSDQRVKQFLRVTLIAIAVELIGFYLAWRWLAIGTTIVLGSQLFFNTAAKIQLYPDSSEPIRPMGLKERSPVLMLNIVALGLVTLWQRGLFSQVTSALVLVMVLIYLILKYVPISLESTRDMGENP